MAKLVSLCFSALFGLVLVTAASAEQQALDSEVFFPEYSLETELQDLCFGLMADAPNARYGYAKFSILGRFGLGLLNIPFGLGSYIAGEWQDGLTLTLLQGGGLAMAFGLYAYAHGERTKFSSNGFVAFWQIVGLYVLIGTGASCYVSGVVNGLSFPFGFTILPLGGSTPSSRARSKGKRSRSLNMSFVPLPDANGNIAGHLALSMSY